MVLGNGEVVTCSQNERSDLFRGAAGAVGSMGVVVLVELQLREAKKYVETTYHPVSSVADVAKQIREASENPKLDHVDGILFSKHQGAIITGHMTDGPPDHNTKVQYFSGAKDPWFYLHVQTAIEKKATASTEFIPMAEYLFRYDRGGFWVGASAFDYFKMPFNNFTRWCLDDSLHTRMMNTALHASGQSRKFIVQDLAAEQSLNYTDKTFGIYPLWLCPLRQSPSPTMHPHLETEADGSTLKPMLNIGLWGWGPPNSNDFVKVNRDLERKLRELGGMKWLYAQTHCTEDEFWRVYDRKWHDQLREKYHASSLPSVYEKVKTDVEAKQKKASANLGSSLMYTWPFSGVYGIIKAISSGTYLQARASSWKSTGGQHRSGTAR